uniref:Uncharacterized protein n=1 Tax=Oryza barthii TaxID=65489 RepID=A0A0D3HWQ9_9ORYZ
MAKKSQATSSEVAACCKMYCHSLRIRLDVSMLLSVISSKWRVTDGDPPKLSWMLQSFSPSQLPGVF